MSRVVVAGAGISGLSAAWDLMRAGEDVVVIESASRAGGVIGSVQSGPFRFETGPAAIQGTSPAFRGLVGDAGLADKIIDADPSARERYLYFHGSLKALPKSLSEFTRSRLFTPAQKIRATLEPLVRTGNPDREETVAEFFGRRVGRGVTMSWVDVIVSGVYAGNPNRLGIRSAFPALFDMEQKHGSMFRALSVRARERQAAGEALSTPLISLKGGLQSLTRRLAEDLGDRVLYDRCIKKLRRRAEGGLELETVGTDDRRETVTADRVVLAVNAPTAGILLGDVAPDVADLIFEVDSADLVVAHVAFDETEVPGLPRGFGFLVPRCMRMRTLGWVFASHMFPEQAPDGKVAMNAFMGGTLDPHAIDVPDDLLEHLMMGELALALGQKKTPHPELFRASRWSQSLPQYNVGHTRRTHAVRALLQAAVPEVVVAGNWVTGISVESCISRGREAAQEILSGAVVAGSEGTAA